VRVHIQGTWPGPVIVHRGWYRAAARPWNDDVPLAQLRLERGGAGFLADCASALLALEGVTEVLSPPLLPSARAPWEAAGFRLHSRLLLLRAELGQPAAPIHPVVTGGPDDLAAAVEVDRAAFEPFWRLGLLGLRDALSATGRSVLHLIRRPEGSLAGFAITGVGTSLAYLQRLAVDPGAQFGGIGHSLARAAAAWAKEEGAVALLTNTPESSPHVIAFYEGAGFRAVTRDLALLGRRA
jgi:GNAT superfamily N-acetyltransferase